MKIIENTCWLDIAQTLLRWGIKLHLDILDAGCCCWRRAAGARCLCYPIEAQRVSWASEWHVPPISQCQCTVSYRSGTLNSMCPNSSCGSKSKKPPLVIGHSMTQCSMTKNDTYNNVTCNIMFI